MKSINKKHKLLCQQKYFLLFQNKMYETKQNTIDCPKANIYLDQDQDTGLIYNLDFNRELMVCDKHYQNVQSVSPSFQNT